MQDPDSSDAIGASEAIGAEVVPAQLVREWVLCAIAAAAARFVPVPLLDDVVRERATQVAVLRTLRAHGREYPSDAVEPLYQGVDGWGSGALRAAVRLPVKLVLFPVRKYVAVFGAVKGVPTDVMMVLLLTRTVFRVLADGRLREGDRPALRRQAEQVRRAHDAATAGMDLRLASGAVSDALSRGKPMTTAAVGYARRFLRRDRPIEAGDLHPGGSVEDGAERVQQAWRSPELTRLLAEFDARVDAGLAAAATGT